MDIRTSASTASSTPLHHGDSSIAHTSANAPPLASGSPSGMNIDFSGDPPPSPCTTPTATPTAAKKKKPTKKELLKASSLTAASSSTSPHARKASTNNRGERMTFELDDVLRKYSPEQFKTCQAYDVGGVNILNKKPVDSKTALDKIKRRRETHNRVERRRRDCINQLIDELTALLPKEGDDSQSKCHRVNILRAAVAHINNLTRQNENLKSQIDALQTGKPMPPPAIITTLAPLLDFDDGEEAEGNMDDMDDDDARSFKSEATSSTTSFASRSHAGAPRSPLSPSISSVYSPASSPTGGFPPGPPSPLPTEWRRSLAHLAPLNLPGAISSSSEHSPSSQAPAGSGDQQLPGIPMIVEPSDNHHLLSGDGPNSKRLNRQTLPKLQLAPPPFHQHQSHQHHHRSNSGGGSAGGSAYSPSFYSQDSSTSPNSAYSGYSSSSAPWSSSPGPFSGGPLSTGSSGGFGFGGTSPRSPNFSNYAGGGAGGGGGSVGGPPSPYSPYSPYGPSSAHAHMSRSPILAPWNAAPSSSGPSGQDEQHAHQYHQQQAWPASNSDSR